MGTQSIGIKQIGIKRARAKVGPLSSWLSYWTTLYITELEVITEGRTTQTIIATVVGSEYDGISFEYSINGGSSYTVAGTSATATYNATGLPSGTYTIWRARLYKGSNYSPYYVFTGEASTEGYTDAEIAAKIAAGYIPIANAADLHFIGTTYSGGSTRNFAVGTAWETGEINTAGLASDYIQVADIDLTHATLTALYGGTWYSATTGWPPIGTYSTADFYGDFDGSCLNISNLYIRGNTTIKALFAGAKQNTMKNIRLVNADVQTTAATIAYTGSLIGIMRDTVLQNVHAGGLVSVPNSDYIGGIVGSAYKIANPTLNRMIQCKWNGTVTAHNFVGGLVGFIDSAGCFIRYCKVEGTINGNDGVGALYGKGLNIYKTYSGRINYNLCVADVNGASNYGGVTGISTSCNGFYNYFDSDVCGYTTTGFAVAGAFARTTAQLKTAVDKASTISGDLVYNGWSDFVWYFGDDTQYPQIRRRKCNWTAPADFMSVWTKPDGGANPLFIPEGGIANRECYPTGIIHTGGKFYYIGKQYDTVIGLYRSDDGVTGWSYVKNILEDDFLPVGWKAFGKYEYNTIFIKDGIVNVIFGIVFFDGTSGVGIATSATIEGVYTINPTMVIDPDNNNTLANLGWNFNYLTAPEWIRVGDTYHWFLCAPYQTYYCLIRFESTTADWLNLIPKDIFMYAGDFEYFFGDREGYVLQAPRVYYSGGYYYLTFTAGEGIEEANQRSLYVARSTDPTKFSISNWQRTPILTSTGLNTWSELRVYCHDILKVNDDYRLTPELIAGKIQMYYSGHSLGASMSPKLTGVPGLATLTP